MFLAVDGDILLYKSAISAEVEYEWDADCWSLMTDLKDAKDAFKTQLETITTRLKPDETVICLSDPSSNFRKTVDPTYKSNRRGTRKPIGYKALKAWVVDKYATMQKPGLEGDDCLGILATRPGNDCIMVSDDKDLLGIKGRLYRPSKDELINTQVNDAERFFLTQVLTGDAVDGYKGCPGIGPKKAETILGTRPHWGAVEQAFIKAGLTKEDALTQARLARILRWTEWDAEKGEVILWKP